MPLTEIIKIFRWYMFWLYYKNNIYFLVLKVFEIYVISEKNNFVCRYFTVIFIKTFSFQHMLIIHYALVITENVSRI